MGHKAAHEYALPKPGRIPREEAWQIVLTQHQGLVTNLTREMAMKLTEGGSKPFLGMDEGTLYDELIGAAQEAVLVAVESRDASRAKGRMSTFIRHVFWRRMQRVVQNLEKEAGVKTYSFGDLAPLEAFTRPTPLPDLEREPNHKLSRESVVTLTRYLRGEWVQASDWLDAREDIELSRMSPHGRGSYNRFLRSKEMT